MKILQFPTNLSSGGIQTLVVSLANRIYIRNDVEIGLVFKPKGNDICYKLLNPNIKIFTAGKVKKGFSLKVFLRVYKIIKKGKYDIVHIHQSFCYFLLPILFFHKSTKFVYTIHSDAIKENSDADYYIRYLKRLFFKWHYMYPVTISEVSQLSFKALYNLDSKLIYNGVEPPCDHYENKDILKFKITNNTRILIHAARISAEKQQIMLCDIVNELVEEGMDLVLVIVGPILSLSIFEKLKARFNNRIIYWGEVSNVRELLSFSDAMCLSSIYEGMPMVVLEALSVGCIPICTPVGGIINVINDGYNGFISQSIDHTSYKKAIERFYISKNIFTIKNNCKKSFELFDVSMTVEQYLNFYKFIL